MVNRRSSRRNARQYPRTARLNTLLQQIIAEALVEIDDERLDLLTVTAVDVDSDLNRAIVYYDSLAGEAGDADVLEAFGARRVRLQTAVGRQLHARKTPLLEFRPDDVLRSAERIDQILRELPPVQERADDDGGDGDPGDGDRPA